MSSNLDETSDADSLKGYHLKAFVQHLHIIAQMMPFRAAVVRQIYGNGGEDDPEAVEISDDVSCMTDVLNSCIEICSQPNVLKHGIDLASLELGYNEKARPYLAGQPLSAEKAEHIRGYVWENVAKGFQQGLDLAQDNKRAALNRADESLDEARTDVLQQATETEQQQSLLLKIACNLLLTLHQHARLAELDNPHADVMARRAKRWDNLLEEAISIADEVNIDLHEGQVHMDRRKSELLESAAAICGLSKQVGGHTAGL